MQNQRVFGEFYWETAYLAPKIGTLFRFLPHNVRNIPHISRMFVYKYAKSAHYLEFSFIFVV